ncbi:MAG: hypothetical protein ACK41T_01045 [Pseudobdellovibrio sp.]
MSTPADAVEALFTKPFDKYNLAQIEKAQEEFKNLNDYFSKDFDFKNEFNMTALEFEKCRTKLNSIYCNLNFRREKILKIRYERLHG